MRKRATTLGSNVSPIVESGLHQDSDFDLTQPSPTYGESMRPSSMDTRIRSNNEAPSEVIDWQALAIASPNPAWSLSLDALTSMRSSPAPDSPLWHIEDFSSHTGAIRDPSPLSDYAGSQDVPLQPRLDTDHLALHLAPPTKDSMCKSVFGFDEVSDIEAESLLAYSFSNRSRHHRSAGIFDDKSDADFEVAFP